MKENKDSPRIGLALGGGGARGLAHIGVLKILEREGIPISLLSGTSMGGLIAAAYASGLTSQQIEKEALYIAQVRNLLRLIDLSPPRRGLLKGNHVREYLSHLLGKHVNFSDLPLPLVLTAVDLLTGREVLLEDGSLLDAVMATISVPGVFPPVLMPPFELVDGGLLNNVPADVIKSHGVAKTIAVDVSTGLATSNPLDHQGQHGLFPSVVPPFALDIYRAGFIMIEAITQTKLRRAQPDILLQPRFPAGINILVGITRVEEIIAAGEQAAIQALPDIIKLL